MIEKLLIAISPLIVLIGCSSENLLQNGSFEKGTDPWFYMREAAWSGFNLSDRYAVDGRYSVHLPLRGDVGAEGTKIFGVIQEASRPSFPNRLSGYYRVENWRKGTKKQYVQFIVILFGPREGPITPNIQIRYILAGITTPPFPIANARFMFLDGEAPRESIWVRFDRDLRGDFVEKWGAVPPDVKKIQVFFEARYDAKAPEESDIYADVYFDKLYLGD